MLLDWRFHFSSSGGYFCFRKTDIDNFDADIPKAYAWRMIKLYLIWTVIYLPIIVYQIIGSESGIIHATLSRIRNFLFAGSYIHLWYLLASAIATMIVCWAIKKKINRKTILAAYMILCIICLLGESYFELLKSLENIAPIWNILKLYRLVFTTTRNGFFFGTIFIAMGALFAYKKINLSQSIAIAGFVISMFGLLIEAFCVAYFDIARDHNMYAFLLPAVFFLFYIATHIEMRETAVTDVMRKHSTIIYFVHLWVNFGVSVVIKILELMLGVEIDINSVLRYSIVAAGSLVVAIVFVRLQTYKPFRWLKNLC